jgi:integrase
MAHIQKLTYKSKRTGKTSTSWQARYGAPDGSERSKRFDRKVDAENWIKANGADIARGLWVDPKSGQIPFRVYANAWMDQRNEIRATTSAKWRGLLDRHILPALGDSHLADVSPSQVRQWFSGLSQKHPSTAAGSYRLLSSIFRTAVDDEIIVRSPCRVKGAATERSAERPTLSIAELATAVDETADHWKLAVLLASWCQLRRGEVLGLQRRDIDVLHGALFVRRTWSMVSGDGPRIGPPKTDAGSRKIAIPDNVTPALTHHLGRHVGPEPKDWLFPGESGGPAHPRSLNHAWANTRKVVQRDDVRFHDLRHSGLTWAAATGASVAELMRRAGHRSPNAALRYQHATEDRDRALASALGKLARPEEVISLRRTKDGRRSDSDQTVEIRKGV